MSVGVADLSTFALMLLEEHDTDMFSSLPSPGPNSSWVELTAVAAVCALLSAQNGSSIPVSDPIHVSIPVPSDSPLKMATSVPVWRYDDRTGKEETPLVIM